MLELDFLTRRTLFAGSSPSQLGQDALVMAVLNDLRGGVFAEVGVGDGIGNSNTYLLEKQFGWSGLLVEANPNYHDSIRRHRGVTLDERAAYNVSGEKLSFVCAQELSTLVDFRDADHHRREGDVVTVETVTLDDAFAQHGIDRLDYLSLDTEGSELLVLQGLDLDRFRPKVINVEHNFVPALREGVKARLAGFGYDVVLEHRSAWDTWFVRR